MRSLTELDLASDITWSSKSSSMREITWRHR
jgi:hypothetical protein